MYGVESLGMDPENAEGLESCIAKWLRTEGVKRLEVPFYSPEPLTFSDVIPLEPDGSGGMRVKTPPMRRLIFLANEDRTDAILESI